MNTEAAINTEQVTELLKLDNQLCFPLYAASRLMIRSYGKGLKKLGLTYSQYIVLMALWEIDGLSVKNIGDKLYLDSGTLTPLLKKMSEAGLVRRVRSKEDDRLVLNYLTPKSERLKVKAAKMSFDLFCQSNLKEKEVQTIRKSLNILLKTLTVNL